MPTERSVRKMTVFAPALTPAHVKARVGEAVRGYYGEELAPRLERAVAAAAGAARPGGAPRAAASISRPSP